MKYAQPAWYSLLVVSIATALLLFPASLGNATESASGVEVTISTELGDIVVEVYPDAAPISAGDFLSYVDRGLYADAAFYRVVRPDNDNGSPVISVIQGGLLGEGGGLAPVQHETTVQTGIKHTDGVISIARSAPGTGSASAFFIVLDDQPSLDHGGMRNPDGQGFAAFGRVIRGMDVVRRINAIDVTADSGDAYTSGQILEQPIRFSAVRNALP